MTENLDKYELVPFEYAWQRYNALKEKPTYSFNPHQYRSVRDLPSGTGGCPVCHFVNERGFIRMSFPIGHELFGRLICCPHCWPKPFGHAEGMLTPRQQKIAAMWLRQ